MSDRANLKAAADLIRQAGSVALACHVGPDGDALGSMLAFGLAARDAGKEVAASFGSPYSVPGNLGFLPTELLVPPEDFPAEPELMVVFDAGSAERLAELGSNASKAEKLIVVDHHATNEGFGDVSLIDPSAAATGELVHDLLVELGWEATPEIAQCLLTALVTDTGRFQYASTSPRTLRLAADLVAAGANPSQVSRHVYEQAPFGYLKAAGAALSRAHLERDKGVVSTTITEADLTEAGIGWGDIDNLIDIIRLAAEADVAVLAKLHEDGRVKVSLRSRGDTDVGALAAGMGGGGHRLAAGFTSEEPPEKVLAEVHRRIEGYR
ncbi:MAG: bifunctional oligoribonuclease/PAP phosphatase NrnA [Actinobacteria bacterium]|nr:bifunctional oligoribonuclease/PAP phosphatase NrnA [Actinomycetota bacterium]